MDAIYRVPAIPAAPAKVLATGFSECGGGMAANASVAVARLGGAASYWGRVGADALGDRILAELASEGVDVGTVRRVPGGRSPSAAILVLPDGERLVCAYNDPALDHIHRAAAHAAVEEAFDRLAHLGRGDPVVVGPAFSSRSQQMNVRSSTRATSDGSERARCWDAQRLSRVRVPDATISAHRAQMIFSSLPSHQTILSGWVAAHRHEHPRERLRDGRRCIRAQRRTLQASARSD